MRLLRYEVSDCDRPGTRARLASSGPRRLRGRLGVAGVCANDASHVREPGKIGAWYSGAIIVVTSMTCLLPPVLFVVAVWDEAAVAAVTVLVTSLVLALIAALPLAAVAVVLERPGFALVLLQRDTRARLQGVARRGLPLYSRYSRSSSRTGRGSMRPV